MKNTRISFAFLTFFTFSSSQHNFLIYESPESTQAIAKLSPDHHYRMETQEWVRIESKDRNLTGWVQYEILRSAIQHSDGNTTYRFKSQSSPITITHAFDTHQNTPLPSVYSIKDDHIHNVKIKALEDYGRFDNKPDTNNYIDSDKNNDTAKLTFQSKKTPEVREKRETLNKSEKPIEMMTIYSAQHKLSKQEGVIFSNECFEAKTQDWVKIHDLHTQQEGWVKLSTMKEFAKSHGSLSYKYNSPSTENILITFKPKNNLN